MAKSHFRLAVLISGDGSNLQAILNAIESATLNARVALVISNRADANGLNRAKKAGVPFAVISPVKGQSREEYDERLLETLHSIEPDLIVLAGFMRILSALFVEQYSGKIINIHPSLLPAYKGLNTHQRVLDAGERYHGVTVHFVTDQLDAGKMIIQSRIEILAKDDAQSLQQRIHTEEHIIYPRAIQWLSESG